MLGADDARLADGQAGELPDPDGQGGGTAHAGSAGRPSSWASPNTIGMRINDSNL